MALDGPLPRPEVEIQNIPLERRYTTHDICCVQRHTCRLTAILTGPAGIHNLRADARISSVHVTEQLPQAAAGPSGQICHLYPGILATVACR